MKNISKDIRFEVYRWMLETRPEKFEKFLRILPLFRYAVCSHTRGDLMEDYYAGMRFWDDVADGHHPLPETEESAKTYLEKKLAFAREPSIPKDAIDQVLLYCYEQAEKLGFSLKQETSFMLESIIFDEERKGKNTWIPQNILHENFFRLDIEGTISASLKIFGEDPSKYPLLTPLGTATRIHYNLRDFHEDIHDDGIINIPLECKKKLRISDAELTDPSSDAAHNWRIREAAEGMECIKEHRATLPKGNFKYITRQALRHVYELPAARYFASVLSESDS